jgi:DNA-binding response OmpR family regulator
MLSQRPRVLVVEDEAPIRTTLEVALRGEGYEVRAEPDGCSLADVMDAFRPDLAVLDVRLPVGPDGYSMAKTLRQSSDAPLLFLTAADAVEDRLAGFTAGADDYLDQALLHGRVPRSGPGAAPSRRPREQQLVGGRRPLVDDGARSVSRAGERLELTRTEYDLLSMLVQHVGKVLSKTQLLTSVWGFDAYDANLVEVHMSALRRKLETRGPRVIHTVRGAGYVLRA